METFTSHKKLLTALFQSAAEGIIVVDRKGIVILANPSCLQMFGYSGEQLIGQPLEMLVASGLRDIHADYRKGFFNDPKIRPMGAGRKLYGRTSAGKVFPIEVSLSHMEVDGKLFAIGLIADITRQKQATDENILLSKIFHESLNDIYIIDARSLRFVKANTGALQRIGYSLQELQQMSPWDLKSDQDQQSFHQRVAPLLAGEKKKIVFETILVRKDHTSFPVEIHLQLFEHEEQRVFMETAMDITERKQGEAALQKEKEIAQRYLDTAASVFLVLDKEGRVLLLNLKGSQTLGYTEEEVVGKNWFEHFIPEGQREGLQELFRDLMQGNLQPVEIYENAVLTKNKEERLMEWHNALIYDEEGQPAAVLSSGIDITEKKKAERDVMKALIEGQEAERERIARDLHDGLGQSFTALQLNLNALQTHCDRLDPNARQLLEKVKEILYHTTQEMKTISRNLMPGVLRDYGLVKGLEYLCQTLSDNHPAEIHMQVHHMDKPLDNTQSVGLYRITQELINNALRHGKATEINIQLIGHEKSLLLMFEDNGAGFDQAAGLPRNGLGLKNIASRVQALNGTFYLDSYPGKGTSVTVEISLHN